MFIKEFINFSKQNWWIYILLLIASSIVIYTGTGNIIEILALFLLNLAANITVMAAIGNYSEQKNQTGAIFHLTSTLLFTSMALYSFFKFNQAQYIIWQICYLAAAIKAITFYNFKKDIKILNPYTIGVINIIFLASFILFGKQFGFDTGYASIIMALGFSFGTTGLVSTNDNFRYWGNYLGSMFITTGASIGTYVSYTTGNINGVDLAYFILTLTAFVYFSKLLPKYLKAEKKS